MATQDPWAIIHQERRALAADLEKLSDAEWARPSLCDGWSVRDVLGHMVATAKMTPPKFLVAMIGSGFRFNVLTARGVAQETAGTPADTLRRFQAQLSATTRPPGPIQAMVGETIVHAEDIRRPLGVAHSNPMDALVMTADFYKSSNLLIGGKNRIAGL